MTFYNRNGILYVSINGIRKSTKLPYSKQNIKKFKSFYTDEEFYDKFNINKTVPTLVELCELTLKEKELKLKPTSYRSYTNFLDTKIKPYFKNKKINEIKPKDINDFYNTFKDYSSLNTTKAVLRPAFNKAIILEYIKSSPMIVSSPILRNTDYEIKPFTYTEAKKIIDFAPAPYDNLFAFLFYTGCRTGEALGLKWENIDFINYKIKIDSQFTQNFELTPKTKNSIRTIDMLTQVEKYLLNQKEFTPGEKYVFCNKEKKLIRSSSNLYLLWIQILKDLNIKYRSIYQTRHTFASNMLSNNENPLWVSQMLGHSSINITLEKYSKYIPIDINKRKTTYLDAQ